MSNSKVCVVGLGNIGKWHAYSFKENGYEVYYIDPFIEDKNYIRLDKLNDFKGEVIIISTNSKFHYQYIKLIENYFKNIDVILEKPIFYLNSEYKEFRDLTKRNNYMINLPMEGAIQDQLKIPDTSAPKEISVYGINWGIGCNILHIISVLGAYKNSLDNLGSINLDLSTIDAKREGYLEVIGEIRFVIDKTNFLIKDLPGEIYKQEILINFSESNVNININKNIQIIKIAEEVVSHPFQSPNASEVSFSNYKNNRLPHLVKYLDVSEKIYKAISNSIGYYDKFPFS